MTLSIDDVAVTSDHVTCAIGVELGDGSLLISVVSTVIMKRGTYGKTLEGKGNTVSESSDGTLCQILDNVGNRVLLGREELVDFLERATLSAYYLDWGTKTYDLVVDPTLSPWKARKPPRSWRDGQEMLSLKSCLVLAHAGVARLTEEGAAETGH